MGHYFTYIWESRYGTRRISSTNFVAGIADPDARGPGRSIRVAMGRSLFRINLLQKKATGAKAFRGFGHPGVRVSGFGV